MIEYIKHGSRPCEEVEGDHLITLIKVWSKVADKGLKAITKKTQIKAKKDEEFIKFIAPTEQALIEMSNAI
ncbi:hypothetical protein [Photobacterium leiognathi]|uniref:hypothetical protein n=1 Tax=Photobacterium leiognathi TaxID=553611 RepID=UPI00273A1EAA|nr:hypothetical protein [Photobacterium leiognathi]